MICKATKQIQKAMDLVDIKYSVYEFASSSSIEAGFVVKNGPSVKVSFISNEDRNDVAIRLFGLVSNITEEKRGNVLAAVNECNRTYRYLKFVLDDEGEIDVEYDLTQKAGDDNVGVQAVEVYLYMMQLMDQCYPVFMRALFA